MPGLLEKRGRGRKWPCPVRLHYGGCLWYDSRQMKRSISDEIADALRGELEGGRYRAGECLPPVGELRKRFEAGEFAVRAALHKLRDEGLVAVTKHVGVTATGKSAPVWKGLVAFIHSSTVGSYFTHKLAMQLVRRFEADGWCMHSVFLEANADGQLDTKVLAHHVSDGLAFAVVLSEFRQISELLDRAAVPYVVLNGYARDFPNARAVVRDSKSESCAELVAYMKAHDMKTMLEVDYERRVDRTFKKLLMDGGIVVQRELCKWDNETLNSLSDVREIGHKAVARFLASNCKHLPNVILFDDDYLAAGGVVALLQAGIRIPEDVTVVTHANKGDEMLVGIPHGRIENDPVALGDRVAKYVLAVLDGRKAHPPLNKLRFVAP